MTMTIDLNERMLKRAEKLSGISDGSKLLGMTLKRYIDGQALRKAAISAKEAAGEENPFWEDYDPKA
jgi:hypothetical protein